MIARGGDGAARKSPGVDAVTTGVGTFDTADGAIPSNYVGQSGNNLNTNYRSASVFDSIDAIRNDGITDAQKELIANLSDPTSVDDGQTVGSAKITPILITETSTTESGTAEAAANAIAAFNQPFSVTASISEYFKIADSSDITVTDTGNGSGVINTYVDISETTGTNTAGIATFKETAEITNIIPAPPAEATKNTTDKTYSATASFRVDIPLAPIDGFLGGNDVPVLSSMVLSQTVDGTKNELNIAANPKTDYANVALAELPDFTTNDHQYYVVGVDEPIDPATLYAFNTAEMGLLDDFVTRSVTFTDENGTPITGDLAPTRTTTYTVTASMSPTDSAPDAVVIPAVSGKTQSKYATIYTQHQIQYQLTNAVCSDGVTAININDGQTHSVTVSPATGYHELNVTVKYPDGSTETPAVADDAVTVKFGDLSGLSGPVIVTATATPKPIEYKVVKVYTDDQGVIYTQTHETTFQAGETLTGVDWGFDKLTSDAAKPGHTYGWKWDTADGTMPETMPAHDLYVYGTLWPDQYDVTIHYYRGAENSENLAHTVQEKITFGVAYTVPTDLTIPGYDAPTPDTVLIDTEAEIPANGVLDPISVIYTPQTYDLVINRIYSDGMVQIAPETQENAITFDQEYAFTVPTAVGYTVTADRESPILIDSESEIPADGQVTLTYTYTPEQYDLIIEVYYNDAVQSTVTKSDAVTFNQDLTVVAPAVENYTPSPATQTIKVDSSTHASLVSSGAVTVRFEYTVIDPGNFVVNYVYVDKIVGETAPDSTLTLDVDGTEYTISVPTGYEAYKDTNKKTPYKDSERTFVGEASQIYNVYLFAKYYTVSLNPDGGSLPDGADLYFTVKHGGAYPQLPNPTREDHFFENWYYDTDANGEYSGDTELVQGGADLKVTSDHTLYAQWTPHIVSVTVAWGNLTFGYAPGWNPEKHVYEADTFTPVGTNAVTVTNNTESNVNVDVTIEGTLIAGDDLRSDDLTFTEDENQTNNSSSDTLTNGESTTFWVWLTGKLTLPDLSNTDFVVGQCTVTISKSEEE